MDSAGKALAGARVDFVLGDYCLMTRYGSVFLEATCNPISIQATFPATCGPASRDLKRFHVKQNEKAFAGSVVRILRLDPEGANAYH